MTESAISSTDEVGSLVAGRCRSLRRVKARQDIAVGGFNGGVECALILLEAAKPVGELLQVAGRDVSPAALCVEMSVEFLAKRCEIVFGKVSVVAQAAANARDRLFVNLARLVDALCQVAELRVRHPRSFSDTIRERFQFALNRGN